MRVFSTESLLVVNFTIHKKLRKFKMYYLDNSLLNIILIIILLFLVKKLYSRERDK